jgi:hypothetical protein
MGRPTGLAIGLVIGPHAVDPASSPLAVAPAT